MVDEKDLMQRIRKIGKLMGDRTVFRIGIDNKKKRIDLISVENAYFEEAEGRIMAELPDPDYIG